MNDHEKFIRLAIAQAEKGDTPFGAVVVQHGQVISAGYNTVKTDRDITAHSEIKAIRGRRPGTGNHLPGRLHTLL